MSDGATEIKRQFTHPFLVFNISARIFIKKKLWTLENLSTGIRMKESWLNFSIFNLENVHLSLYLGMTIKTFYISLIDPKLSLTFKTTGYLWLQCFFFPMEFCLLSDNNHPLSRLHILHLGTLGGKSSDSGRRKQIIPTCKYSSM